MEVSPKRKIISSSLLLIGTWIILGFIATGVLVEYYGYRTISVVWLLVIGYVYAFVVIYAGRWIARTNNGFIKFMYIFIFTGLLPGYFVVYLAWPEFEVGLNDINSTK